MTPAAIPADDRQPCCVAIEDCESGDCESGDLISAFEFFEALKFIIGNDGEVLDKSDKKKKCESVAGRPSSAASDFRCSTDRL